MSILKKFKKFFFGYNLEKYNIALSKMNEQMNGLKNDYKHLESMQKDIEKNPDFILNIELSKKDKYIEEMEKIKYKDINLIKEYEMLAMKYNILVDLFNKVKKYIFEVNEIISIEFKVDFYNQPIAIISHLENNLHKILLLKNTLQNEEYIVFKIDECTKIIDVTEYEHISHLKLLLEIAYKEVKKLYNISENILFQMKKNNNLSKQQVDAIMSLNCIDVE